MSDETPVPGDMLHAYVDGMLPPEDVERVEAWLAGHPEDATTVAAWRMQNALIRDVYDAPDAVPPVPAPRRPVRWSRRAALAAAVAAFVVGLGAGLGLGMFAPAIGTEARSIAGQATTAYRVFSVEKRHPVEVGADEREHLVRWLSNRLAVPLALPDLSGQGLDLVGGRLTASDVGPAALFMFEAANGDRYTIYLTRPSRRGETAFRFETSGDVGACYWLDHDLAVVVNGPADRDRLQAVANAVYEALSRPSS